MNNIDLVRELQKIGDTLSNVERHLRAKNESDAALHLASVVRYSPLTIEVKTALQSLGTLVATIEAAP